MKNLFISFILLLYSICFSYGQDTLCVNHNDKLVVSVYNDLLSDCFKRANIGIEAYYENISFFVEGSFSNNYIFGKLYNIDFWHIGCRGYFKEDCTKWYIEYYGRIGYFDTNLFSTETKYGLFYGNGFGIGYKFVLGKHWKICPNIRFGIDVVRYHNYKDNDGSISIMFDKYVDGKTENTNYQDNLSSSQIVQDKTINKQFFNTCYSGYCFGIPYIGITIQRDFYIKQTNKHREKN